MRTLTTLLLLLLLAEATRSQDKPLNVSTSIKKVTVFTDGAQITRSGSIDIPSGKTILSFNNLSPFISKPSIQVKGEGAFTILSVNFQVDYLNEKSTQSEVAELEQERKSLTENLAVQNTVLDIFNTEEATINKNQQFSGTTTGLKADELKSMLDFQRSRLTEVKMKELELQNGIDSLTEKITKINEQLSSLQVKDDHPLGKILVEVSAKSSLKADFILNYVVNAASWFPSYDLRLDDISKPMELTYKATIQQNSGEDWNNVKLSLSSTDATTPGVRPFLNTWMVGQYSYTSSANATSAVLDLRYSGRVSQVQGKVIDKNKEEIIGASVIVKGTTIGTYTDEHGNFSLSLPANYPGLIIKYLGYKTKEVINFPSSITVTLDEDLMTLEEVKVASLTAGVFSIDGSRTNSKKISIPLEVNEAIHATSFSFDIANPYTILSTGKNFTVEVKKISIPAIYQYYAAPKLNENAFLTAMITDWDDLHLLDGEMSIYLEGTYVGPSVLDLSHSSDTLTISLGVDKNVQIERTRLKAFNKKSFIGGTQTDSRAWEISIRNAKSQPIYIVLQDQFPVSAENEVKVERTDSGGGEVNEDGTITWRLNINPKEEKKIDFKFGVSYPKTSAVAVE